MLGYLLFTFSQSLPFIISWPIRIFCSLTGITALWRWVSGIVTTVRGIKRLCSLLSAVWSFFVQFASKSKWLSAIIKAISATSLESPYDAQIDPNSSIRLILLGPAGGGRTSLANTLSGSIETRTCLGQTENAVHRAVVDGMDFTVIDTPDLLGASLPKNKRTKEALRSLQLTSPGPHAFLLVMPAPSSGKTTDQGAVHYIQAARELYGDEVLGYIVPVLTGVDTLGQVQSADELLDADEGNVRQAVSLCGQAPELVANSPNCSSEVQSLIRRQLVGRVTDLRLQKGYFVHELQRKENRFRRELLADMAPELAKKLK